MSPYPTAAKTGATRTILLAGLIAGTLDILTAFVHYYILTGKNPVKILNYIASGVFGREAAYGGGTGMALLGLLFHYVIAFAFTVFFFWLYPRWNALAKNKWLTAIGYGLFVWAVMNLLVLPFLTRIPGAPFNFSKAAVAAAILICMIGVPVSLMANAYYKKDH
ncbi:MAG: hypothetical protein JWQ78_2180 [Sediminibacterium sp.]|nr:hypothetical protein [Sediminibacterium sp.]